MLFLVLFLLFIMFVFGMFIGISALEDVFEWFEDNSGLTSLIFLGSLLLLVILIAIQ